MPKAKDDVTPAEVQRAKTMRAAGKGYKEIAKALGLASEKVAWHVVNSAGKASGKAPGKASGKASRRPVAGGRPKAQPKARKASGAPVASPRGPKKASRKAPKPEAPKESTADVLGVDDRPGGIDAPANGKRLNMQEPNGGDRPVARPSSDAFNPVPKPKDRKPAKSK